MFRHSIPIGRIFGISIDLDYSWFLIIGLLAWILAVSYFPAQLPNWSTAGYWLMGGVTAVMLFVSVLIHELGHSVVAKGYGLSVPRITLFIFGGVSEIAAEPPSAVAEFWIAIVGPVTSFALAAFFWEIEPFVAFSPALLALAKYLALLNLVLGAFNLIPGFPLDGGRVLRAVVWRITGKYQQATSTAAATGRFFGFFLIFLGVWQAFGGNLINGLWIIFIGWFLESAAGSQLKVAVLKNLLGGHKVVDAMKRDFPKVSGEATLQELVDKHVLTRGERNFVVNGSDSHSGMVTLDAIQAVPRAAWPTTSAFQAMVPLQKLAATNSEAMLWPVLEQMGRDGVNQLPVVDGNRIVGILSRDDILHYLRVQQMFSDKSHNPPSDHM
ncbi:MAG TPA: site-2 protease family protein [Candidatus Dormibacteraeota bacterium]|nr:site-2 protease family protein [Candidatus Dormibacteraeota bacterium]